MTKFTPLYEFTVQEKAEKINKVKKEIDGKTVTVEETETVESPVKVFFKKPNRRDEEDADLFFAKRMNEYVNKHGLMTKAMLYNKYKDSGGLVSEETVKDLVKVYSRIGEVSNEIALLEATAKKPTPKQKVKLDGLKEEYASLQKQVIDLQQYQNSLLSQTADSKAENDLYYWYLFNCTFMQREEEDPVKFIWGDDFESQKDFFFSLEEEPTDLYNQMKKKVDLMAAIWLYNKGIAPEKFKEIMDKNGD
jgi:hypothetical protein